MKGLFLILLPLIAIFAAGPASADDVRNDGNLLLPSCNAVVLAMDNGTTPKDKFGMGFCLGLVQGITMSNRLQQASKSPASPLFCIPQDGIENGQAARVLVKYLREHPQHLHLDDFTLAISAFQEAYPCAPRQSGR